MYCFFFLVGVVMLVKDRKNVFKLVSRNGVMVLFCVGVVGCLIRMFVVLRRC